MSSIMELVSESLAGNLPELSQQLGADRQQTEKAIGAALPTLIGAMSRKADSQGDSLLALLDRDGDGSALDDLAGFMGQGRHQTRGNELLDQLLGGRRGRVESAVSQASGLRSDQSAILMQVLGPLVMGALGRKAGSSSGGLDLGSLISMMQDERASIERHPRSSSLLGWLLDQDGDGDFDFSDMASIGMGMLSRMFKR